MSVVPLPPVLVATLREHISTWGTAPDGRIFFDGPDRDPISISTVDRTWARARKATLTQAEMAAGLAKRPYDLRHGAASYLLSLGIPPVKVAAWLGHSVPVLLSTYTHFIDTDEQTAFQLIEAGHNASESASPPETHTLPGGGPPAGQNTAKRVA